MPAIFETPAGHGNCVVLAGAAVADARRAGSRCRRRSGCGLRRDRQRQRHYQQQPARHVLDESQPAPRTGPGRAPDLTRARFVAGEREGRNEGAPRIAHARQHADGIGDAIGIALGACVLVPAAVSQIGKRVVVCHPPALMRGILWVGLWGELCGGTRYPSWPCDPPPSCAQGRAIHLPLLRMGRPSAKLAVGVASPRREAIGGGGSRRSRETEGEAGWPKRIIPATERAVHSFGAPPARGDFGARRPHRFDRLSDCLGFQAGCHGFLSLRIALRMVRSLRATAMRASFLGFPAATRRW